MKDVGSYLPEGVEGRHPGIEGHGVGGQREAAQGRRNAHGGKRRLDAFREIRTKLKVMWRLAAAWRR